MEKNKRQKNVFEKILSIFAWLTLFLALIFAMLTIFSSFSDEKNGKEIFKHKFLLVKSDSMSKSIVSENEEIFFNSGDVIIIKTDIDVSDLKEGDVISFFSYNEDSYGKTLTHKIRSVKRTANGTLIGFETYGINTGVSDEVLVPLEAVMGKYKGKIKGIGNIFSFLKTPQGYSLGVLIPLILLIVFFSIRVGKYVGEKQYAIEQNAEHIEQNAEHIEINAQGVEENAIGVEQNAQNVEQNALEIQSLKNRIVGLERKLVDVIKALNVEPLASSESQVDNELSITEENSFAFLKNRRISFINKLLSLEKVKQDYFNVLHNELCSFKKISSRLSFKGISYRLGRLLLAKITVRGKTLKLHLALDVNEFNKNVYFQQDFSSIKAYEQVPFAVKIRSERAKNNAIKLIQALMDKNEVVKNEKYTPINAIKDLSNQEVIESAENIAEIKNEAFININRKAFFEKLLSLEEFKQGYFDELHNELCSFKKISSRLSFKGISYRLGRLLLAKITVRGKTLKLHLALDVDNYNKNVYFQQDFSSIKAYMQVPFTVKIRSERAKNNAIKLIQSLMDKNEVVKNDNYKPIQMVEIIKRDFNIGE